MPQFENPAPERNVLLMVADDLGKFMGCYGCDSISTPNLDRLGASGTIFDRGFASTASCSPSRSTIYTGLHTHENGQYGLAYGHNHFETFETVETAPRLFNDLNYRTGIIGKVHVGPVHTYPYRVREESTSRNVAHIAERCGEFFDEAKFGNEPFFLTVGFVDPHRDLSRGGFGNNEQTGGVDQGAYSEEDVEVPYYLQDLPEVRQELAEYYRAIHRMDRGVGLILDELDRVGALNNTLVIFMSDNGPPFINSKTTMYDAGICLPLIIRQPGQKSNVRNPNLVSWTDVLPTMLDYAGAGDRRGPRLGRSLLPILEASTMEPGFDRVFGSHTFHEVTNYWPTRYCRTEKFKYHRNIAHKLDFPFASDLYASMTWEAIRNSPAPVMIGKRSFKSYLQRPPEELYDMETDPDEVDNLAYKPEYAETVKALRAAVEQWQSKTRDPWLYRDGQSISVLRPQIKMGLAMPDQWDVNVEDPSNKNKPIFNTASVGGFATVPVSSNKDGAINISPVLKKPMNGLADTLTNGHAVAVTNGHK